MPAAWASGLPFGYSVRIWTGSAAWLSWCDLGKVDGIGLYSSAKLEFKTLVAIVVRQRVIGVEVAGVDEVSGGFIMEGRKVFATVVVVVFHDLLSLLHHSFDSCFFLLFASILFSFLGIRRVCVVRSSFSCRTLG